MRIKRQFEFTTLNDIINAVKDDYITPQQAVLITCKALTMINLYDAPHTKEDVLNTLKMLNEMQGEKPLFFGVSEPFQITDIYKPAEF